MTKNTLTRTINFLFFIGLPFVLSGCKGGGGSGSGSSSGLTSGLTGGSGTVVTVPPPGGVDPTGGTLASVHDPEPTSLLLLAVGMFIIVMYFRTKAVKPCLK
ncbi:MAG: hypothetical protein KGJ09_06765 [Candidatus Omnitrophica bacterium]|nr:hypothetical protein [Candidatus Omnitrophota bacterium]MDE2232372.1 hypothetical protein [Candidatus Omnitrophota bacterium]